MLLSRQISSSDLFCYMNAPWILASGWDGTGSELWKAGAEECVRLSPWADDESAVAEFKAYQQIRLKNSKENQIDVFWCCPVPCSPWWDLCIFERSSLSHPLGSLCRQDMYSQLRPAFNSLSMHFHPTSTLHLSPWHFVAWCGTFSDKQFGTS